jgi:hypothetical protein
MPEKPVLTAPTVERLLVSAFDIKPEFETNFFARYKNLVKLGLPVPGRQGKGRPALYDADSFFISVVALDLTAMWLPPSLMVNLLVEAWPEIRSDILAQYKLWRETNVRGYGPKPYAVWTVPADAFSMMSKPDRPYMSPVKLARAENQSEDNPAQLGSLIEWKFGYYELHKMVVYFSRELDIKFGGPDGLDSFMSSLERPWDVPAESAN